MINFLKPWTHVAIGLPEIDFQSDVGITCDGLQQNFQHAEYFTRNPLTSPIVCHMLQQCRCFLGTACNPCDEQIYKNGNNCHINPFKVHIKVDEILRITVKTALKYD